MDRVILHCDLNCFYASVELLSHPDLRDVPMAVCGDPNSRHGIILAKNEPAKKFGIPATNLATKGDSITFSTPTIEGTIMRRNREDAFGKHPWKAEVTEGAEGVSGSVIESWYDAVYEPAGLNITPINLPGDSQLM